MADIVAALIAEARADTTIATTLGFSTRIRREIDPGDALPRMCIALEGGRSGEVWLDVPRVRFHAELPRGSSAKGEALLSRLRTLYHDQRGNVLDSSGQAIQCVQSYQTGDLDLMQSEAGGHWEAEVYFEFEIAR